MKARLRWKEQDFANEMPGRRGRRRDGGREEEGGPPSALGPGYIAGLGKSCTRPLAFSSAYVLPALASIASAVSLPSQTASMSLNMISLVAGGKKVPIL